MVQSGIPADVQGFLLDYLESLEQLQILVLLQRGSDQDWSVGRVAQELRIPVSVAEESLVSLRMRGLLAAVGGAPEESWFRYRPISDELARQVDRLIENYAERRVDVLRLMTANAIERLRAGVLGVFSSALLLGRRPSPHR